MAHKVNPLEIPIIGEVDTLSIQVNPFQLFPETVQVYYILSGPSANYSANMTIPADVVAEWGTDDTVVLNYVLGVLGLTIVETIEE